MGTPRLALRLLTYGDTFGLREELIGDIVEEIGRGRSALWAWHQLIGLYGFAFTAYVRDRARIGPPAIALTSGALLLVASSIGSLSHVLAAWLSFYYVTGALSLFAHMTSRAVVIADRE
jgi:hypothetical protein